MSGVHTGLCSDRETIRMDRINEQINKCQTACIIINYLNILYCTLSIVSSRISLV